MSKQARVDELVKAYLDKNGDLKLPNGMIKKMLKDVGGTRQSIKNMASRARAKWSRQIHHPGLAEECEAVGIPFENVTQYWHKSKHYSVFVKNQPKSYEEIRDDLIADMQHYAPEYPKLKRKKSKDAHLLVIDPADIHIGKLCESFETGEDYDNQIAVQRVRDGVAGILEKSKAMNIDQILLIIGNDVLHTDNQETDHQRHATGHHGHVVFQLSHS